MQQQHGSSKLQGATLQGANQLLPQMAGGGLLLPRWCVTLTMTEMRSQKSKWAHPCDQKKPAVHLSWEFLVQMRSLAGSESDSVRVSCEIDCNHKFGVTSSRLKSIKSFGHVCILRHGGEMRMPRRSNCSVPMNHQRVTARPTRESGGAPDLSSELGIPTGN